jgi:uncharacterized OB-fold protein
MSSAGETLDALDPLHTPPQPIPDHDSQGFWEATAHGELAMCRCTECRRFMQPPLERCRHCAAPTAFEPVAGTGEVYTFTVQHRPVTVGYIDKVPYAIAVVELDEQVGLRLPGRLVDVDPADVRVGMRVRARLEPLPGGQFVVPVFAPDPDRTRRGDP